MERRWARPTVGALVAGAAALALSGFAGPAKVPTTPAAAHLTAAVKTPVVHVFTEIVPGKMIHKPGWPKYTHPFWTVKKGDLVVLTIRSYDTGASPLSKDSPYGQVLGTVNGKEQVDGKWVKSIPDAQVAHTFTVPGLGLNIVVPAVPAHHKFVTVVAEFKAAKAGVFDWQCEAPCGTTSSGWGGPMLTPGWMQGAVTVKA
jgi:hypothetical protein